MRRTLTAVCLGAGLLVVHAAPAYAHSEFQPSTATAGETTEFTLYLEDEEPDGASTKVELQFPQDVEVVLADAPTPDGWTVTVDDGEVGGPVGGVTWEAEAVDGDINLPLTLGPLPTEPGRLQFKVVHTYDNGVEAAWLADWPEGAEEPSNPGPVIDVLPAGDTATTLSAEEEEAEHAEEDAAEDAEGDEHAEDDAPAPTTSAGPTSEADNEDSSSTGIVIGAVVLLAVAAAGGFLVVRSRRT